jgi:hypothetical protein
MQAIKPRGRAKACPRSFISGDAQSLKDEDPAINRKCLNG